MFGSMKYDEILKVMEIVTHGDVAAIVERISLALDRSVALLDPQMKALVWNRRDGEPLPAWEGSVSSRYNHYHQIYSLQGPGLYQLEAGRLLKVCVGMPAEGEVFLPVFRDAEGKHFAGYLWFSAEGLTWTENLVRELHFVGEVFSLGLRKFAQADDMGAISFVSFLEGMLSGAISDNAAIESFLERTSFRRYRYYAFLVIGPKRLGDEVSNEQLWAMAPTFSAIWPESHVFVYGNSLGLLLCGNDGDLMEAEALQTFQTCLEEHDCVAGVGDIFDRLDIYVRNYYQRCRAAMVMARGIINPVRRYLCFPEVGNNYILKFGVSEDAAYLINPRLLMLIEHDCRFDTKYLSTLRYFWLYGQNSRAICDALYIHRNTLFYRLKKIRAILKMDLQNTQNVVDLCLSIALLERRGDIEFLCTPIQSISAPGETDET